MVGRIDLDQRAYRNAVRRQRMRVVPDRERTESRVRQRAVAGQARYVDYALIFTVIVLIAFACSCSTPQAPTTRR